MVVLFALLSLAGAVAVLAPRLLARAEWPEREPVLALLVWQCVVATVLIGCIGGLVLSASAAWEAVRDPLFAFAPHGVQDAYGLGEGGVWAAVLAIALALGGLHTAVMLIREVRIARAARKRRRAELLAKAPLLPGEEMRSRSGDRLLVIEDTRPGAWWLAGPEPQLVITTAALRRLKGRRLDAVIAHERGHARARHHWLQYCAAALATGFPRVPVFAAFRRQVDRLVEMAADDSASRRCGRLTTALALVDLNEERGVFDTVGPVQHRSQLPVRVDRLLAAKPRLTPLHRLRLTVAAMLGPFSALLVALGPGLYALV